MTKLSFETRNCAVARSLDIVGEWWSMMIILDMFAGSCRFDEFQQRLGISRSVLTNRLNKLVKHNLIAKKPLNATAKRQGYFLTDKGRELLPALVALHQWGNQWLDWPKGQPLYIVERESGKELPPVRLHNEDGHILMGGDLTLVAGEGADKSLNDRFGISVSE